MNCPHFLCVCLSSWIVTNLPKDQAGLFHSLNPLCLLVSALVQAPSYPCLFFPPHQPLTQPCVGLLAKNNLRVGGGGGGAGSSYHSRKDCFYLKGKKKEHESSTRAEMQGSQGRIRGGTARGVQSDSPSGSLAARAGNPGERSREGEKMVVPGSVKLAGRALGPQGPRNKAPWKGQSPAP